MNPVYVAKLGLKIWFTKISTEKIDDSILKIFKMVLASLQVNNKFERARFF